MDVDIAQSRGEHDVLAKGNHEIRINGNTSRVLLRG